MTLYRKSVPLSFPNIFPTAWTGLAAKNVSNKMFLQLHNPLVILLKSPKGNSNLMPRLETRQSQTRHFKKPCFPCFELKKWDLTDL